MGGEGSAADNSRRIHRISRRVGDSVDALLWADDRDPLRSSHWLLHFISAQQCADDARLHIHRPRCALIKADVKLRRHNLHYLDVPRNSYLARAQVVGPFAGPASFKIQDGMYL